MTTQIDYDDGQLQRRGWWGRQRDQGERRPHGIRTGRTREGAREVYEINSQPCSLLISTPPHSGDRVPHRVIRFVAAAPAPRLGPHLLPGHPLPAHLPQLCTELPMPHPRLRSGGPSKLLLAFLHSARQRHGWRRCQAEVQESSLHCGQREGRRWNMRASKL